MSAMARGDGDSLEATVEYIKYNHPDIFVIADAKRGDIGNTSKMYAKAFLENMPFDAVTVAPYMGEDSVTPFLSVRDKWVVLLALTSNKGADDFQYHEESGVKLFERVLSVSRKWGTINNMMYVVGATRAEMLKEIRKIVPDHFLLVPGVGAQGGSLEEVARFGMNSRCGLLVNSSRGIIFADNTAGFDRVAGRKSQRDADRNGKIPSGKKSYLIVRTRHGVSFFLAIVSFSLCNLYFFFLYL